jgi:sugar lactone lactonase YvrE
VRAALVCRLAALAAATCTAVLLSVAGASAAPYSSVTAIGKTGGGILRFPQAIAYDNSGVIDPAGAPPYVYVPDQYSFLVQKFTRSGTFVRQWGGFGSGVGRFGKANGDTVGGIGGLAVDAAGRVYVLDSYNDRIQRFTADGTFQRAWGTTGMAPGEFQLGINGGIAIHGSSLFVADQNNHRVQRFTLDSTGTPVGTPLTFGSFGSGEGQLDRPQGVGVDATAV